MANTLPLQGAFPTLQLKLEVVTLAVNVAGSAIKNVTVLAQLEASRTVSECVPWPMEVDKVLVLEDVPVPALQVYV